MKTLQLSAALAVIIGSVTATGHAASQPFSVSYDSDGQNRETRYATGPVARVVTASTSATELELYIFPANGGICEYANAVDQSTGEHLANAQVEPADIITSTRRTTLQLPVAAARDNKLIQIGCTDSEGNMVEVQHKVPGAPTIDWSANLTGEGEWQSGGGCGGAHCNSGFGRYPSLNYTAQLSIDNNTAEAYCYTEIQRGAALGLFRGEDYRNGFYSDVFSVNRSLSDYEAPVILQKISCENAGGKTTSVQVWDVSSETIQLLDNISFSR